MGALAYIPSKRASRQIPQIKSWPEGGDKPQIMQDWIKKIK